MFGSKLIFNLLIAAVVLVLLFFGYRFLTGGDSSGANGTEAGLTAAGFATRPGGDGAADEFLATLTGLRELNLRGEIFSSAVFRDLQESSVVLPEQTPGRPNPFAPVNFNSLAGAGGNRSATSSSGATADDSLTSSLRGN